MGNIKNIFKKYKSKVITYISVLRLPLFAVIIGFLGSYAGSTGTSLLWRRAGIAVLSTIYAYIMVGFKIGWLRALYCITIMS